MVEKHIRANIRAVIVVAIALTVLVSSQTFAVGPADVNNSTNVLKVSPVRTDIEIKPGATKIVPTTVTNLTNEAITVHPIENDFVAADERGTPALILSEDKYAPTHSLKRFMLPLGDVTIPAGKAKTVNVVVAVPKNAKAGGYYGAVRFAPTSPDGGGQVNLSSSVASLILMTVPGDIVDKLELTDFDVQQNGKSGSYFANANDLKTSFRFKNNGNVQVGPFGKVSVTKDDKVIYEADFNDKTQRDMILPDSARRWDVPLKNIGDFGQYKVSATFTYGQKNQTIEVSKSFWVIPTFMIIAAIVSVVVLIALIVGIVLYARSVRRKRRGSGRLRL